MFFVSAFLLTLAGLLCLLALATRIGVWWIERKHPPIGEFATVNGTKMHFVHMKPEGKADLPPMVFLHGASGNLKDPMEIFASRLKSRAELLFVDRPGHGWSERGPEKNAWPDGQAATIAALLSERGIDKAIIVGHSFGGSTAASFALFHPDKTLGTLFLSPATHPWPGGLDWYYDLTPMPVIGWLFSETVALPAGLTRLKGGTKCVFAPNKPPENFLDRTAVPLVLRPKHFRSNAHDVANLLPYVTRTAPRYSDIKTPAIIITGDKDTIVLAGIHSVGLKRAIANSELLWVHNLGHKPDYIATDLVVMALENLGGAAKHDLQAEARRVEQRLANEAHGPLEKCAKNKLIADAIGKDGMQLPPDLLPSKNQ